MTFEPITQPRRWLLTPLRVPKRNTRPSHFTKGTEINCPSYLKPREMQKHTTVKPKHCIKCIWFWMTVDYCSEKCTMRQLSTLFKMHSIDMVDYEGHLPILHASLLIWAGNWKRQRRTKKQKKRDKFKKHFIPFILRVQTTYWYDTAVYEPDEYGIPLKTSRPLTLEQNKDVQFTREICDAYWTEKIYWTL